MLGARDIRKPAAYCRITDYVEHSGPEGERLKDVLQFTCVLGSLTNLRGKSGITFMWPTTKVLEEIENALYKGDSASMWTAQQRLRAHILCDVYNEKNPFVTGKQAVNCLVPSRGVTVKKATSKTVEFDKGAGGEPATAVLDEGFKVMTDPANPKCMLAVWRMKTGEMPLEGPEMKAPKLLKKKAVGGDEVDHNAAASSEYRKQIISTTEQLYAVNKGQTDVYLNTYASLFNFLKTHYPDVLCEVVIPLTSCTPIDLYLILEPFSTNSHLIKHSIVEEWWKSSRKSAVGGGHEICSEVIKILTDGHPVASAGLYSNTKRVEMLKKVNESRARMLRAVCTDFRNCVQIIKGEYETLQSASGDFWPNTIRELYNNAETKIAHDDLRYITKMLFDKLAVSWSDSGFSELRSTIEQCLKGACPRANLIHGGTVRYTIDGGRDLQPQIYAMCASDYLWYFPHTLADSNTASAGMKLLDEKAETGHKGLWRDLVFALCKSSGESSLDSEEVTSEAHRELFNALRQVLAAEPDAGDSNPAVVEARRVLSKYH